MSELARLTIRTLVAEAAALRHVAVAHYHAVVARRRVQVRVQRVVHLRDTRIASVLDKPLAAVREARLSARPAPSRRR